MGSDSYEKPNTALAFLRSRTKIEKSILGVIALVLGLVLLKATAAEDDYNMIFVLAEAAHFLGIGTLAYKLWARQTVAGVSLKTQELSALYLGIRLTCSLALEMDMHTLLDGLAFLSTVAIILSIRFTKLRETYQKNLDNMNTLYIGVPCVLLALVAHPMNYHWIGYRVMWALSIFLEVVAVLPQLRMMQNAQMVEKLTAHYVFSLGVSRFLNCAHWTLLLLEGSLHSVTSQGTIWGWTALFAEIAQSSILADFCYYYLKAHTNGGNGIMRLPRLSRVV